MPELLMFDKRGTGMSDRVDIRVPTLVIHRTEDVLIKVEGGRYLPQNIPGARYRSFREKTTQPS